MSSGDLRPDCDRCLGLCCVAPAFALSADFPIDKPPGVPCPNLGADSRCAIYPQLRQEGFAGCLVYDCFGAGQKLVQLTFGGRDWRQAPAIAEEMFRVFPIMRQLHLLLWHLAAARQLEAAAPLAGELELASTEIEGLSRWPAQSLLELDLARHWQPTNDLLLRVSERVRAGTGGADHRGADLCGGDLAGADLRGASLRGARLIGADLRGADLRLVDFTGADLRGADLGGADLGGSIFLTQSQLIAAVGDEETRLPPELERPTHWSR